MSMFESERYEWRETYFVLFKAERLPTAKRVEEVLRALPGRFKVTSIAGGESGKFEGATLESPQDYAALEISYLHGDEVREYTENLVDEMLPGAEDDAERARIKKLPECDARLDVMHFEQIPLDEVAMEGEPDELFDPSALLIVLEALSELVGGTAVDPQAGTLF